MSKMELDAIDLRILAALQSNARISNVDLAKLAGLSPTPCLRRIRRLEEAGVIAGYSARLDREKAGLSMTVFVHISLENRDPKHVEKFHRAVAPIPEVVTYHALTGQHDFLLEVVVSDWRRFTELMLGQLGGLPGVKDIYSTVVLETFKQPRALPLPAAGTRAG